MDKQVNVKIPLLLLRQTITLLEYLDTATYGTDIRDDYDNVYRALLKKRQSLDLRDDYAKIIFAADEDARHAAKMQYLRQKRLNSDF